MNRLTDAKIKGRWLIILALSMAVHALHAQSTNPILLEIHRPASSNGWIHLDSSPTTNTVIQLESTTNLQQWNWQATLQDQLFDFPDPSASFFSQKFYRAWTHEKAATNDWKNQILFPNDPFRSAEIGLWPSEIRWVKFAIDLNDPVRVYFQDSRKYLFHYDYATARLPGLSRMSPAEFDQITLYTNNQQYLLGTVLYPPPPNASEFGIQFVGQDPYAPESILKGFELVAATVAANPGVRPYYIPTFEQAEVARTNQAFFSSQGVEISSIFRWIEQNQCYATGWALGRLKYFEATQIDQAFREGRLEPGDILLTDQVPAEVPFLAGILTLTPATPNSHVAILARSFGIPFAFLSDPDDQAQVQAMVGRKVALRVVSLFQGCQVTVIDLEGQLTPELEAQILDLKTPPELDIQPKTPLGSYIASADTLTPADIQFVGGKAANYGLLRQTIPEATREAIAFSFDLWDEFLDQPLAPEQTLRSEIVSRLSGLTYPPDIGSLSTNLAAIRNLIREGTVFTSAQQQAITNALALFDPVKKIRFRSSTNVEDSDQFTGAGLYDSFSGCLLDDLDGDNAGPSHCDPLEPEERGVFRAMKKVYASFYNDNAFLERLRHGLDESQVGMGLLVHHSFPDDMELANGVATMDVTASGNPFRMNGDLVTQWGATPVTNPDGNALPEVINASRFSFGTFLNLSQRSSLVPLGGYVLDWQEEYQSLVGFFGRVTEGYALVFPNKARFLLDFEYKKVAPDNLIVKQVREIPLPNPTNTVTTFLLNQTNEYCVFQGEAADVFSNHRLKSRWSFAVENQQLTEDNLKDTFYREVEWEMHEDGQFATYDGLLADRDNFTHTLNGTMVLDGWTLGQGQSRNGFQLETHIRPEVPVSEPPLFTIKDFGVYWRAEYRNPKPSLDWRGVPVMVTNEIVNLVPCPTPDQAVLFQERFLTNSGVVIHIRFYWPEEPTGIVAGYTAPLVKWEETIITGLTTDPIVLRGYYSQTYRPGHHNFTEEFIFEPRLEAGLPPKQLQELEEANIQLIHIVARQLGDPMLILGLDGIFRSRP